MIEKGFSLRGLELSDLELLFELENDTRYWKYASRSVPYTKTFLTEYILQSHFSIQEAQQLRMVVVNSDDQPIGLVDLFDADFHNRRAAVGIGIHPNYQGNGLGTIALQLVLAYCTEHLSFHQLYCDIDDNNKHSIQLFEKAGFVKTGTKMDWNFYEGDFHPVSIYQKIL